MSDRERIAQVAHFWVKNERFAGKTDEQIPSPVKCCYLLLSTILLSRHGVAAEATAPYHLSIRRYLFTLASLTVPF